ncbi:MAG: KTSC domain-containing protein [Actinomycetota bacterium]
MEMIEVESSMIYSIGYDGETSTMMIVFRNGQTYEFHLIPHRVYVDFLASESKGKFFMDHLKFSQYGRRVTKLG